MKKKPGVFDPWRQQDPAPAAAEPTEPLNADYDAEAPAPEPFHLRGRHGGVFIEVPPTADERYVERTLCDALADVPERVLLRYAVKKQPWDDSSFSIRSGDKVFYCYTPATEAGAAYAAESIALSLIAGSEDPAFAEKLSQLKVTPYHR